MLFVDLLRLTVLLSAGAATALAALTVVHAATGPPGDLALFAAPWWFVALVIGAWLGRRSEASPAIARLLASARTVTALPDQRPGAVVVNRLWPLGLATVLAGGVSVALPPVAAIATGFAIIWALAWRRQDAAVAAIEERDGVRFHVDQTSPLRPIRLVRTPGLRGAYPQLDAARRNGA